MCDKDWTLYLVQKSKYVITNNSKIAHYKNPEMIYSTRNCPSLPTTSILEHNLHLSSWCLYSTLSIHKLQLMKSLWNRPQTGYSHPGICIVFHVDTSYSWWGLYEIDVCNILFQVYYPSSNWGQNFITM